MYRRTLLIRRARAEIRDGRGLVLAAATGAALIFLGSDLVLAVAAGVAVEAVKAMTGAAPALMTPRRIRVTDTEAAQWLDRAEEALVVLRKLARGSPPGPLAQRCAEIAERAVATVWAMRRIAEQGNAVARLLSRMPVTNVTAERATLERELVATSDPRLRDDLARSLAAVRTQVEVRAQLASSRHVLIARMRSVALGMEGLVARLAELLALAATGVASADDRVGELEAQLDALREGLLDTERIGQEGIERLEAASVMEVGKVIRTLRRTWRYLTAALDGKLETMLDPRIQIDQAIDEAKHRHALLTEQAAAVRASERELDVRIARKEDEAEKLRTSAEQSLVLADRASKAGHGDRARSYERTARTFAGQLTAVEASLSDLRALLGRARASSTAAMRGVEQNAFALQQQVNERARLLTELEAAKLQERMADAMRQFSVNGLHPMVPTLEDVRERVDRRLAHATARGELLAENADARMVDVRKATIDLESGRRLDEIRESLGLTAPANEKEAAL